MGDRLALWFYIRTPKWELSENEVTSETVYSNRRHFPKGLVGLGIGASLLPLTACQKSSSEAALEASLTLPKIQSYRKIGLKTPS